MANRSKYTAIVRLTIPPATTIEPGETVELDDQTALILLKKQRIQPARTTRRVTRPVELEEFDNGTND